MRNPMIRLAVMAEVAMVWIYLDVFAAAAVIIAGMIIEDKILAE